MVLEICNFKIESGGHSEVFINTHNKIAYKLFYGFQHNNIQSSNLKDMGPINYKRYIIDVYISQVNAYNIVQKSAFLIKYTPKYFGHIGVDNITFYDKDISSIYELECCYALEFIHGNSIKLLDLINDNELQQKLQKQLNFNLRNIISRFEDLSIKYLYDASVIYNENCFKIIDFGDCEIQPIIL
jgi:hypothetical protein